MFWGAHGQASGRGPVDPYFPRGGRHPLDGSYALPQPVTRDQIREREPQFREVYERLQAEHPGKPLYFPFQFSDSRPVRAFQGYLTKFPRALVAVVPELAEVESVANDTALTPADPTPAAGASDLGTDYRPANPRARTARRQPFEVDPDLVDRVSRSHARTQEALAAAVRAAGLVPRSPNPGEPFFDLAWDDDEILSN